MTYSSDPIEQLCAALEKQYPLHDFKWRSTFSGAKGLCPEHDDRNPSLSITYGDNGQPYFYCFACGFTGNLAKLNGKYSPAFDKKSLEERKQAVAINDQAINVALKFKKQLMSDKKSGGAKDYLSSRVDKDKLKKIIKEFPIGLIKQGYKAKTDYEFDKKLEGCAKYGEYLVFVYDDGYGHITKFHLRKPFSKDFLTVKLADGGLFNYHKIRTLPADMIWITEGEFDAITLTEAISREGYLFTASGSTSNINEQIINRILNNNKIPILAMDWDEPGQKALIKIAGMKSLKHKLNKIWTVQPDGYDAKDPDELFKDKRSDEIIAILSKLKMRTLNELLKEDQTKQKLELQKKYDIYPSNIKDVFYRQYKLGYEVEKISIRDVLKNDLPPLKWIFDGFRTSTVGLFLGSGGIGKSFLAMQLAMCTADTSETTNFLGLFDKSDRGIVGYVNAEDPALDTKYRIKNIMSISNFSKDTIDAICNNFEVVSVVGKGFNLMNKNYKNKQINHEWANWLTRFATSKKLVILDTLSRLHTLDGNDNSDMASLLNLLETIADQTGASILMLHHISKAALLNGISDSTASRGASALVDNSRFVMQMQSLNKEDIEKLTFIDKDEKRDYAKVTFSKLNYSKPLDQKLIRKNRSGVLMEIKNWENIDGEEEKEADENFSDISPNEI